MVEKPNFTPAEFQELRNIVRDWISEGFTTPPYSDEQYGIFEKLELPKNRDYDIMRPA